MPLGGAFWAYWSASALANLGDGIRLAAFPLLAAQLSDDPLVVGAVGAVAGLPWLLTGLLAGSLADRFGARFILPLTDAARVLVLAGLVGLLVTGRAGIAVVVVAAFLLGVAETLRDTAAATVLPRLVAEDQLERAGGRLNAGGLIGNEFVGPVAGGLLFGAGAALPFAGSGAATAFAVLLVLSLPAPVLRLLGAVVPADRTTGGGIRDGLAWLRRQPVLRALVLVVALIALADSAWFAVLVLYAEARLGLGPTGFGLLLALGAGGGLAGALLADRLVAGRRHRAAIGWSAAVTAGTPGLLLLPSRLWLAAVVVVATSAAFGVLNVAAAGLRYRLVPRELLGRVSAAGSTSAFAAGAAGALAGGAVASARGLTAPFVLSVGLGGIATALWFLATRAGPRPA
ncbi:MAG TPA: MFS transporter [Mycobacteriales bacterium]